MDESSQVIDATAAPTQGPPRSLLLTAVLSFFVAGLGHVYAGQARRGLVIYGLCFVAGLGTVVSLAYIPSARIGSVVALLLLVGPVIGSIIDAVMTVRRNRDYPRRRYQRWWVYLLIWLVSWPVAFVLAQPMRLCWLEMYSMPTSPMSNTIMAGDRFIVEKRSVFARKLKRGDVVVYYSEGSGSTVFSKRIIGLPGDVIEFRDESLIRNGIPVDEPYVKLEGRIPSVVPEMLNLGPLTVPDGELFLAGDNRRWSDDSRTRGTVPANDIIGHVMTIYWSWVPEPPPFGDPADFGIDDDHPSGTIRWNRIGKRIINDAR